MGNSMRDAYQDWPRLQVECSLRAVSLHSRVSSYRSENQLDECQNTAIFVIQMKFITSTEYGENSSLTQFINISPLEGVVSTA